MSCDQYREALSARLDGADEGPAGPGLTEHLARCPGCAQWYAAAQRITRLVRLAPAEPVPDLVAAVLAAAGPTRRLRPAELLLRAALGLVAVGQFLLSWPSLLGHDAMTQTVHGAHESGAWNLALAIALVWVAARPRHAAGLLPLLAACFAGLLVVSLVDLAGGYVSVSRVATHLLIGCGLCLVAALTWVRRSPRPQDGPAAQGGSALGGSASGLRSRLATPRRRGTAA